MTIQLGRWAELNGQVEFRPEDLRYGMDFRLPVYRRAVFLMFWEFHLKYRSHPGIIYMLMPHLAYANDWSHEQKLWFAFINGCTQNPVTSWVIFQHYPDFQELRPRLLDEMDAWFHAVYPRLAFDTDRRYHKKTFMTSVRKYRQVVQAAGGQTGYFACGDDEQFNFRRLWKKVNADFYGFGRLSSFSYLEYLRVMGLPVECDQLFLDDMTGSKSHRNGLCKVLGRDDLDWHDSNQGFDGQYGARGVQWLSEEAAQLLAEARARFAGRGFEHDVGYFTLESTLCTFKGWFRENRRYPNVYQDMLVERLRTAEANGWEDATQVFWEARKEHLPAHLRLEACPADAGCTPWKQNHFRLTGQPVMMDREWPCFRNDYNDEVDRASSSLDRR